MIEATGVMQVPEIWGMAAFAFGVVAIGGVFLFFTKER
jgi:hypothetical protein